MNGLTHVYYGDGKGKTTCAIGLAVRAAGCGMKVMIIQFLKNTECGEIKVLSGIEGVTLLRGKAGAGFTFNMTQEHLDQTTLIHNSNLMQGIDAAREGKIDLLVLDEVMDAYQLDLLDKQALESLINDKPKGLELVITGHTPVQFILEKADYVSEIKKVKHPYDKGINARKGIEY